MAAQPDPRDLSHGLFSQIRPDNETHEPVIVMPTTKKPGTKRELIEPHPGDKRYVRREADGTFGKTVDVGRSLAADQRQTAKTKVAKGQGDRGDTRA